MNGNGKRIPGGPAPARPPQAALQRWGWARDLLVHTVIRAEGAGPLALPIGPAAFDLALDVVMLIGELDRADLVVRPTTALIERWGRSTLEIHRAARTNTKGRPLPAPVSTETDGLVVTAFSGPIWVSGIIADRDHLELLLAAATRGGRTGSPWLAVPEPTTVLICAHRRLNGAKIQGPFAPLAEWRC